MGACTLIKLALPDKLTRLTVPESSSTTMGDMLLDYIFPRYSSSIGRKLLGQKYLDVVFRTVLKLNTVLAITSYY